jgi:hypothetical protein
VFLNLLGAAQVALIRTAASTLTLGILHEEMGSKDLKQENICHKIDATKQACSASQ